MAKARSISDLFPKPRKSKTASGKSLQSIFDDIYKKKSGNAKTTEKESNVFQKQTKNNKSKISSFTNANLDTDVKSEKRNLYSPKKNKINLKVKIAPKEKVSKANVTMKQNTSSMSPKKEKFRKKLLDSSRPFKEIDKLPVDGKTPNSNLTKKEKIKKERHRVTKSLDSSKHRDADNLTKETRSEVETGSETSIKEKIVNNDIDFPRNKSKKRKFENDSKRNAALNVKISNLFNKSESPIKKLNKHTFFDDDEEDNRTSKKRPKLKENPKAQRGEKRGKKKNSNLIHEKRSQEDEEEQSQEDEEEQAQEDEEEQAQEDEEERTQQDEEEQDGNKIDQKQQKNNKWMPKEKILESPQRLSRTLFVGNLPLTISRKDISNMFKDCGAIENVRLRGGIPEKSSLSFKVAEIKKKFSKHLQTRSAFVVFKSEEDAKKAHSLKQSILFENRHIVVDFATQFGEKKMYDGVLSVFIGNLPFDVDEEAVRSVFQRCGTIENVRIIRDKDKGVGKGFGYVLFKDRASKNRALKLKNANISGREIRVKEIHRTTIRFQGNQSNQQNKHWQSKRWNALKLKKQEDGPHKRKSTKKIMKKQKSIQEKKKMANILQKKTRFG